MSLRLVTHTSPCGREDRYCTNFLSAKNLPGLPMILQCSPMVIIFGVPSYPSASKTSNAAFRYSKKASGENAPVVLWNFKSLLSYLSIQSMVLQEWTSSYSN